MGGKLTDLSKFTDDELKKHRVGGRMVTRREVTRSKKCKPSLALLITLLMIPISRTPTC